MEDIAAKIADLLDNDDAMKQMASILSSLSSAPKETEDRTGEPNQGGRPDSGSGEPQQRGGPAPGIREPQQGGGPDFRAGEPQQGGGLDIKTIASLLDTLGAAQGETSGRQDPAQTRQPQGGGGPDLGALLGMLGGGGGPSRGSGPDLGALAGLLGGMGGGRQEQAGRQQQDAGGDGGNPGFDPRLLGVLTRAMAAMRETDPNIQLLDALRPYLEGRRREKVDEAIKVLRLLKLVPLLQESGIFSQSQL